MGRLLSLGFLMAFLAAQVGYGQGVGNDGNQASIDACDGMTPGNLTYKLGCLYSEASHTFTHPKCTCTYSDPMRLERTAKCNKRNRQLVDPPRFKDCPVNHIDTVTVDDETECKSHCKKPFTLDVPKEKVKCCRAPLGSGNAGAGKE